MANLKQEEKILTADLPETTEKSNFRLISLVVLLSFLFGVAGSVFGSIFFGQPGAIPSNDGKIQTIQVNEQSAVVDVVKRASPAVVSIIISKDLNKIPGYSSSPFFDFGALGSSNIQEVGGGSGFIISADGLIATNKHVVDDVNATYTVLTNDGKKHEARVLSRDPVNDLALVKIEGQDFPTVSLGDSTELEIGQRVIAIGNSLGQYRNTVTTGVVSGIGRTVTAGGPTGSEHLEGVIQTDAAINPGNSGGPLLDIGGSVIGINTAVDAQGQLVGFAIPVEDLQKDIESFREFGRIIKPFLGVRYVLVNQTIREENELPIDYGALIVSGNTLASPAVMPGSAADKAGLKEGDVILEINGTRIDPDHSLAGLLKNYDPADVVQMKVWSAGQTKDITVTLGESK